MSPKSRRKSSLEKMFDRIQALCKDSSFANEMDKYLSSLREFSTLIPKDKFKESLSSFFLVLDRIFSLEREWSQFMTDFVILKSENEHATSEHDKEISRLRDSFNQLYDDMVPLDDVKELQNRIVALQEGIDLLREDNACLNEKILRAIKCSEAKISESNTCTSLVSPTTPTPHLSHSPSSYGVPSSLTVARESDASPPPHQRHHDSSEPPSSSRTVVQPPQDRSPPSSQYGTPLSSRSVTQKRQPFSKLFIIGDQFASGLGHSLSKILSKFKIHSKIRSNNFFSDTVKEVDLSHLDVNDFVLLSAGYNDIEHNELGKLKRDMYRFILNYRTQTNLLLLGIAYNYNLPSWSVVNQAIYNFNNFLARLSKKFSTVEYIKLDLMDPGFILGSSNGFTRQGRFIVCTDVKKRIQSLTAQIEYLTGCNFFGSVTQSCHFFLGMQPS